MVRFGEGAWLAVLLAAAVGCGGDGDHGGGGGASLPPPADLRQYEADGTTPLEGGSVTESRPVVLEAVVPDAGGGPLAIDVEVRRYDEPFTGTANAISGYAPGGRIAATTFVPDGDQTAYRWRARAVDVSGRCSDWVEFTPVLVQGYLFAFAYTVDRAALEAGCAASAGTAGGGAPVGWLVGLAAMLAIAAWPYGRGTRVTEPAGSEGVFWRQRT